MIFETVFDQLLAESTDVKFNYRVLYLERYSGILL